MLHFLTCKIIKGSKSGYVEFKLVTFSGWHFWNRELEHLESHNSRGMCVSRSLWWPPWLWHRMYKPAYSLFLRVGSTSEHELSGYSSPWFCFYLQQMRMGWSLSWLSSWHRQKLDGEWEVSLMCSHLPGIKNPWCRQCVRVTEASESDLQQTASE